MKHRPRPGHEHGPTESFALEISRVHPGEQLSIRTLSAELYGLFTHWVKGRSRICNTGNCEHCSKRIETVWKGYAPVHYYSVFSKLWVPTCLEVTEHAELDLRGQLEAGQIWTLSRAEEGDGRKRPVTCVLSSTGLDVPPPFDFRPVLKTVYHVVALPGHSPNPLPPRVLMVPMKGAPPPSPSQERPQTQEEWNLMRQKAVDAGLMNGNGQHVPKRQ